MSVYFANKSTIELDAIALMGVSVKDNENPIGYFGTGLKFSIATLLRTGHAVTLFRDGEKIEFTKKTKDIRGENFDVICMGDKELGFTTKLGRNWKIWQAYRELHCNCTDEGGVISDKKIKGDWGTLIVVEGEEIADAHRNRHETFLQSEPFHDGEYCGLHKGASNKVFYRGVRALDLQQPALFTYNIKTGMTLTEDRTLPNEYGVKGFIAESIATLDDEEAIERFLTAPEGMFEHSTSFGSMICKPSDAFLRTCQRLANNMTVNKSAIAWWRKITETPVEHVQVDLDVFELRNLEEALKLCKRVGCNITRDDFFVVDGLGPGYFGAVKDNQILIAKRTFDMGARFIASTLYEEWLHLEQQQEDCSRDLQNLLFEKLFSFVERLNALEAA